MCRVKTHMQEYTEHSYEYLKLAVLKYSFQLES